MFKILFAFLLFVSLSIQPNHSFAFFDNGNNDLNESEKFIYVDASLNINFVEKSANPYLLYCDSVEHYIKLVSISNNIFKTELPIPSNVFSKKENSFYLTCFNGEYKTDTIFGANPLSRPLYDCITLSNDTSIAGYGIYEKKADNPGATYKTQRVWLLDNSTKNNNQISIAYITDGDPCLISMVSFLNGEDHLYYVDVPHQLSSFNVLLMDNYIINYEIPLTTSTFGKCYSLIWSNDHYVLNPIRYYGASARLLGFVVEAYLTMGTSPSNGTVESTVHNIFDGWFSNKLCTKEELKQVNIMDYSSFSGNTYEGKEKDKMYSVYEKWSTMCNRVNIDPWTGQIIKDNWSSFLGSTLLKIVILIGIGASISVGGIVAYYIYQKKKRKNYI